MIEHGSDNPERLDWHVAGGLIREYLPQCRWEEEVVELERPEPGRLELQPDGHRRYWFHGCRVRVRRPDGEERDRVYSFVFDWAEGRWQLCQVPAVCV